MIGSRQPKAWLLLAAGEKRKYGGNTGYHDEADVHYSWDSTVKNYGNVTKGDRIALWDTRHLIGLSVVEAVHTGSDVKAVQRCPNPACRRTNISARVSKAPKYRCQKCFTEFEEPDVEGKFVSTFVSRHDAAWTPLVGLLSGEELRRLCLSPGSIHSMRELDWAAFSAALAAEGATQALKRVTDRSPDLIFPSAGMVGVEFPQGHTKALVRVRRGQNQFRSHLLKTFGGQCAFTGPAPDKVLEAGHLYSYAELGQHHEHGGLLLRRDIHRLFDDGWLAVDPANRRVDVSAELASFPQYAHLHDRRLDVKLESGQARWLERHWAEHRTG